MSSLVQKIITSLTPSITSSVQNALAAQQQSSFSSGSKFSSTGSSSSSLSSSSSSSSSSSKSALVTKILNILQPRIVTLVSEAFSAQQAQAAALAAQFSGTAGSSEMTRAFSKDTGETAAVLVEPDPPAPDSMIDAGLPELDDEGPMTQERAMLEAEQV